MPESTHVIGMWVMSRKSTILFFASNPKDVVPLKLDEEARAISDKIEKSEHRDALNLVTRWAARPDDLLQELNRQKPTVVHFSGHGSKRGELILMNERRESKPVSASALEALFRTLKDNVRLVVLNACYSQVQARAIGQVIDCVIGMKPAIGDQAAITFAASLYRAIGFGRTVKEAFEQAKVALMLEGIPHDSAPELIVREGVDPDQVRLVEPPNLEDSTSSYVRTSLVDIAAMCFVDVMRLTSVAASPAALRVNLDRYPEFVDIADQHLADLRTQITRLSVADGPGIVKTRGEVERGIAWAIARLRRGPTLDRSWPEFATMLVEIAGRVDALAKSVSPEYYAARVGVISRQIRAIDSSLRTPDDFVRARFQTQSVVLSELSSADKAPVTTVRDDMDSRLAVPYFAIDLALLRRVSSTLS